MRKHWHIENYLHCVSELLCNLACVTNTATSIIGCQLQFRSMPEANRNFANRTVDALDLLLIAPGP